jgi:hypothetical protein
MHCQPVTLGNLQHLRLHRTGGTVDINLEHVTPAGARTPGGCRPPA